MTTAQNQFSVSMKHNLLTVDYLMNGATNTLCVIDLVRPYSAVLQGKVIACQTRLGQVLIEPPAGTDAGDLLKCISTALNSSERRRDNRFWAVSAVSAAALAAVIAMQVANPSQGSAGFKLNVGLFGFESLPSVSLQQSSAAQITPQQVLALPAQPQVADIQAPYVKSEALVSDPEVTPIAPSTPLPADGWDLPQSVREGLPAKIKLAAEGKLFTVDYSSGHARTLYVFADPECPNCQRLEPALEAAAEGYNVVVFPVAVIGGDKSIASIVPVLCLPSEQRKAAWMNLYDLSHGMLDMDKPAESDAGPAAGDCDAATKALGVNEVAYRTFRIPGTPWVIADDGRHVPQSVLQDPSKLQAFMGKSEVANAAE